MYACARVDQRGGWVRRFAVLAILGAAWAVVTPSVARAEYDNPPVECAGHTIMFMEHQEAGSDDRLIVRRGQTVVRELKVIYFSEVRCVELTGDIHPNSASNMSRAATTAAGPM